MAITKIGTPELFDFSATNTALQLPTGDTASRPATPSTGEWRFNTTEKYVEYYDGGAWRQIDTEAVASTVKAAENFNTNTYFGNGDTQAIEPKFNGAANFRKIGGDNSNIQTAIPGSIFNTNTFSISFWYKRTTASQFEYMIGTCNSNLENGFAIGTYNSSDGYRFDIITRTTSTQGRYQGGANVLNVWTNIVMSVDNNDWTFYQNGSLMTDYTGYSQPMDGKTYNNSNTLFLGQGGAYSAEGMSSSFLGQVRVFDTALTGPQVTNLWNNETTTTAATLNFPAGTGCIAAYQLDGNGNDISNTYNGTTTNVGYTGLQFQPDLVWIKERSNTSSHNIADSVRGSTKYISSDLANGENNLSSTITSFDSNGFSVGNDGGVNQSAQTYVAWCFKAAASTTTIPASGSQISSDVRANVDAGFSVVKYTGTGSTATVGHGLGSVPKLILTKVVSASGNSWACYSEETGIDNYLELNTDLAKQFASNYWGSAVPTTSVFGVVDANFNNNVSGANIIAYCFADISGYQKVGTYTGNGSEQTETTGFVVSFLMIKRTNGSGSWIMVDKVRDPSNPRTKFLAANSSAAEVDASSIDIDFLSDGFSTNGSNSDINNGEYIYLAIA